MCIHTTPHHTTPKDTTPHHTTPHHITPCYATRAVLCCAVLCCAVLCCAVLCCAVLCCAVLCCGLLYCPHPSIHILTHRCPHVACSPTICGEANSPDPDSSYSTKSSVLEDSHSYFSDSDAEFSDDGGGSHRDQHVGILRLRKDQARLPRLGLRLRPVRVPSPVCLSSACVGACLAAAVIKGSVVCEASGLFSQG